MKRPKRPGQHRHLLPEVMYFDMIWYVNICIVIAGPAESTPKYTPRQDARAPVTPMKSTSTPKRPSIATKRPTTTTKRAGGGVAAGFAATVPVGSGTGARDSSPSAREKGKSQNNKWTLNESACSQLSRLDVVIIIIHCAKCSSHMCVRHDEAEFSHRAQHLLRKLSRIVHSSRVCARVGILRVPLSAGRLQGVWEWEDSGPESSRTGAFEVSVVLRDARGELQSAVLFSRIDKDKWPVAAGVERRLESFISPYITTNTKTVMRSPLAFTTCGGSQGQQYPIGACEWQRIKTSDKSWGCPPMVSFSHTPSSPTDVASAVMESVQWIFDTRCEIPPSSIPLLWTVTKESYRDRPIMRYGNDTWLMLNYIFIFCVFSSYVREGKEIDFETVKSPREISWDPAAACPYCDRQVRGAAIYRHMIRCRCQPKIDDESALKHNKENKWVFDVQKHRVSAEASNCRDARKAMVEKGENVYRAGPFYALPKQKSRDFRASLKAFKELKRIGVASTSIEMRVLKVSYSCPSEEKWQTAPCAAELSCGPSWIAISSGASAKNGKVSWSNAEFRAPNGNWEGAPGMFLASKLTVKIKSLGVKEPLAQGVVSIESLLEQVKSQSFGEDTAQEFVVYTNYSAEYAYSIRDYRHYESSYAGKIAVSIYCVPLLTVSTAAAISFCRTNWC
jgi:hypothetical protein